MNTTILLVSCGFDKTPTPASLGLEFVLMAAVLLGIAWLARLCDRWPLRLGVMAVAVLLFELFTAPMWDNLHLGWWAYLYQDVSWILTLGWSVLLLLVVALVDRLLPRWREWKRFLLVLLLLDLLVVPLEIALVAAGVRGYAPEVRAAVVGGTLAGVPLEMLYYVPVFSGLLIAFYKYWMLALDNSLLIPVRRLHWLRGFVLATVAVLLFELMVEPMVMNRGFPAWSYLYRDISLVMTGVWILVIAVAALVVERLGLEQPTPVRYLLALMVATAIALPIEYGLYLTGFRVYGPSAVANFTGFRIAILEAPIEIAFAIPCYLALMIAFIRYWEICLDNHL